MVDAPVQAVEDGVKERRALYTKASIYIAISVLAAGGALIVAFILTGAAGDVIARAFLTLILLAGFSFAVTGESYISEKRYSWVTLAHISVLVLTLLVGLWHVWSPEQLDGESSNYNISGSEFTLRTMLFIVTAGALQLVSLGYSILGWRIARKRVGDVFLTILAIGITAFSVAVLMLTLGFTFPHVFFDLPDYWRWFAALFVISTVMILIPVLARALNPEEKKVAPVNAVAQYPQAPQQSYPAGWYSLQDTSVEQFWDGTHWTAYTRPAGFDDEAPPVAKDEN